MPKRNLKKNILIAGIGGASLGTEIFKSLKLSKRYRIFGVDISSYAYGLYEKGFFKTFLASREKYIKDILQICEKEKINAIIPGGEEPLKLLCKNQKEFEKKDIFLAINSPKVIDICTDKIKIFDYLKKKGVPVPFTKIINKTSDLKKIFYPCVMKPSTASGGSVFVYVAENYQEADFYTAFFKKKGLKPLVQEYITEKEGEYSLGILSLSEGELVGSIALRRFFCAKLSITMKTKNRVISSPYSQGLVDSFEEIRKQGEKIAEILDSRGPLNIQGRLKNGIFYPFEINPRFSGGTYLRAMAGFNEVDMFLQNHFSGEKPVPKKINYGYYFRSLEEKFVGKKAIKKYD